MLTEKVEPIWADTTAIVAASGPSLTPQVAALVRASSAFVIAVNDAFRMLPSADVLYAADLAWWQMHDDTRAFEGERWSSHSTDQGFADDKSDSALGLYLVAARAGAGFSSNAQYVHYGETPHSGFQAVNLALLFGARRVILVGFDMRRVGGRSHFFGEHPRGLRRDSDYAGFIAAYSPHPRVLNATPGSALDCFERVDLVAAINQRPQ